MVTVSCLTNFICRLLLFTSQFSEWGRLTGPCVCFFTHNGMFVGWLVQTGPSYKNKKEWTKWSVACNSPQCVQNINNKNSSAAGLLKLPKNKLSRSHGKFKSKKENDKKIETNIRTLVLVGKWATQCLKNNKKLKGHAIYSCWSAAAAANAVDAVAIRSYNVVYIVQHHFLCTQERESKTTLRATGLTKKRKEWSIDNGCRG